MEPPTHFMFASLRNLNNGLRCLLGLISRRWVFGGPRSAAFILSSECNSHCIMCWFHSPHIDDGMNATGRIGSSNTSGTSFMDFNLCETMIRELHELGTPRVILAGWGEPLLQLKSTRYYEA
jgi:hypothetical protein